MFNHKLPTDFPMQTLRKKTSPCKYKNEPGRFLGEGVSFRAKLIGVLEVPEARGDRMCQEALADLKMAIRAAGEHKQRIQVHVAIDGLRLRDDKTGDSLYHHPVHKISFIAQDMTDSRAFGYIFGSPDTGHRFFGIKTDKAASQVVIAMRDLFQVVFELKKKEIELAKQQLEGKSVSSSLVSRHTPAQPTETKTKSVSSVTDTIASTSKQAESGAEGGVAELVDLEQELSSLRRGLTQVEGLTPSTDPFGDSFIVPASGGSKGLLPPPPSGSSTRGRNTPATSTLTSRTVFSPNKSQAATLPFDLATVAGDFEPVVPPANSLVDTEPPVSPGPEAPPTSGYDVFTELDPLGTGRSKPYVDKKLFFQELKNPPKKVLKDLVQPTTTSSITLLTDILPVTTAMESKTDQYGTTLTSLSRHSGGSVTISKPQSSYTGGFFSADPFAETDPFDSADPFSDTFKDDPFINMQDMPKNIIRLNEEKNKYREFSLDSKGGEERSLDHISNIRVKNVFNGPLQVSLPPEPAPKSPRLQRQLTSDSSSFRQRPQPSSKLTTESASPPPPLPPKKAVDVPLWKAPPRPPHEQIESKESVQNEETGPPLPPPSRYKEPKADRTTKPRLSSIATNSSEDEYLTPAPPPLPGGRRFDITLSQLLTCSMEELSIRLRVPAATLSSMTLPQLTTYLRSYLASDLDRAHIHVDPSIQQSMIQTQVEQEKKEPPAISTLPKPVSKERSRPIKSDQFEDNFAPATDANGAFVANFDDFDKKANPSYDRYAVFREIQEQELKIKSILDPDPDTEEQKQNGDADDKNDSDKEEIDNLTSYTNTYPRNEEKEPAKESSRSPLKTLDELTLDSFNMFRNSVSPKPSQIDSKIEDIKNVMKNLQIEQSRRSVSPRDNNSFVDAKPEESNLSDRYAALREITITEPPDEFESIPPEAPKERKRSDEKSDGFDNSDFFDCIDNSSLSFSHVDDAFRKSPVAPRDKVEDKEKIEDKKNELTPQKEIIRDLQPPPRLSAGSLSDVASASSPDTKDKSIGRRETETAGRWSVLAARASPWSSDSRDSECAAWRDRHSPPAPPIPRPRRRHHHCHSRQTSSSSRDVSPWEEEPPPVPRHHRPPSHHRESRHNSSGSRECLDSGSGRDKDKIRDKRDRSDISRDGRESVSTRDRDRRDSGSGRDRRDSKDREHRDRRDSRSRDKYREKDTWVDRDYSRERDYRDSRSRERLPKEYIKERDRDRHRKHSSWDEEEDYSDGCGSGRSSPRERWPEHRWRRDERNYGSLGWRESRRRAELRTEDSDRRYGATLAWANRRTTSAAVPPRREPERRRARRDEQRHRTKDHRFSNDFSPREREHSSPFDNDFTDTPTPTAKKRAPYSNLEGTRFAFDPDETASPLSASSTRVRDGDSPATRFRFDSDSVSPRSMFEDDFTAITTPRARAASIAEEDEGDLPPLRNKPPQTHKDIKKSESVNIFVRETDPFEGDDFFACTGSDRAARRENWPGDFQAFDNV